MKVIIELNENVTIENVDDDVTSVYIHLSGKEFEGAHEVKIEDLKLALKKLTAK